MKSSTREAHSDRRPPAIRPRFTDFAARFPWRGGDLQTLRNFIVRPRHDLSAWPATPLTFAMGDGTGDRLLAEWHRPPLDTSRPLVVLLHGLTGCADSYYIRAAARNLLEQGYPVLRLNLRGAGATRAWCAERYHAGRSQDLRDVLAALPMETATGVLAVGFSLGANILLKYLGEAGAAAPIQAAVVVSVPIDLAAASRQMSAPRNRIYLRYLLNRLRHEAGGPRTPLSAEEKHALGRVHSIFEYDDRFVAPRNGFANAADYYARCSAARFLDDVAIPTLVIHALDDPWIPAESCRSINWQANRWLTPLISATGGHVGFHGRGSRVAWHDLCTARFFDHIVLGN